MSSLPELSTARLDELVRLSEELLRSPASLDEKPDNATTRLLRNLDVLFRHPETKEAAGPKPTLPERIGRYHITRMLGAGGFAVVYHGEDRSLSRDVAVKVPLPRGLVKPEFIERFVREGQAAARLDHPHIVTAYEAGEDQSLPYIVYSFCSGPTLATWLRDNGPLPPDFAAMLLVRLADAIAYSHRSGIVHRDLKPANVLLFPTSTAHVDGLPFIPKVTDFGLAKLMEEVGTDVSSSAIVGTPLYLAPEQVDATAHDSGPLIDVFGLGCLLYETLTGRPPFEAKSVILVIDMIRSGRRPSLHQTHPHISRDLIAICDKALATLPGDRYRSAEEMRDDLVRYLQHERVAARPIGGMTRLARSLQAPSRIAEAAGYLILSHAALLLWISAWPAGILLGIPMTRGTTLEELMPYTAPLMVQHLLSIGLGIGVGHRKRWAAIIATVSGLALAVFVLSVLMRWINPPYPSIYPNERTRDIVFLLLFSIFAMQSILSACSWRAISHLTRRTRTNNPP